MLRVEKIQEVRRLKYVNGLSIKEIVRRAGVSRGTVRKILRSDLTQFTYRRTAVNQPVTGPIKSTLEDWIKEDQPKRRKQRRTAWRMYEILSAGHGYAGSYESIAKSVREISERLCVESKEVYIPLAFEPGEAFQFDWGEAEAFIGGEATKIHIAITVLCHSRHFYARAYQCQKQELLLDAQRRAFEFFGGVPRRGIYDNMRTAVKKLLRGSHRNLQERFVMFCSHYLFGSDFCSPAKGNEKGIVESMVGVIRRNFFVPVPHFKTMEELNERLTTFSISYSRGREHPDISGKTRHEVYEEEKDALITLPPYGFECSSATVGVVSKCSTVFFDNNRYSVPVEYAGKSVLIKGFAEEVSISYGGTQIARHPREFGRKKQVFEPLHYLSALQRKPGAIKNGLPFKNWQLPEVFMQYRRKLNERYESDGDRYFAKTLILLKDYPIKEVSGAIGEAVTRGILGDSYILAILRGAACPLSTDDAAMPAISSDLARYTARQRPPEDYDRIWRERK